MKFKAFIIYGSGLLVLAALISLLILYTSGNSSKEQNIIEVSVVARVNGTEITGAMLNKQMGTEFSGSDIDPSELRVIQKQTLDNLIEQELFLQEADSRKITVSDSQIDNELQRQFQIIGEDNIRIYLDENMLTIDDLKEDIRINIIKFKLEEAIKSDLEKIIEVSSEEISNYYEENKEDYNISSIAHIYIKINYPDDQVEIESALKKARMIIEKIKTGENFTRLARQYSDDNTSKNNGGELGPINSGYYSSSFLNAALKLKAGQSTATPLMVQDGIHIIKRLDSKYLALDDVRDTIVMTLTRQELETSFKDYLNEMKSKAEIKVFI